MSTILDYTLSYNNQMNAKLQKGSRTKHWFSETFNQVPFSRDLVGLEKILLNTAN